MMFTAIKGDYRLETVERTFEVLEGTAVGFQIGRKHRWIGTRSADNSFCLFLGSISRRAAVLQGLADDVIIVPPDAEPTASILRNILAILLIELDREDQDNMIRRRCAEIIQGELIRFARTTGVASDAMAAGIAHDAKLLRAWSAYFADPRRRWTVAALAKEAGLSRTAFATRFTKLMGVPPLTALTDLRLEQAVAMLRESNAPLIEIAFTVGYASEAAFVRAFRRKYGIPPGQFRHSFA
ncbi:MAG: helix-turn-helix transcriptional regulator [Sphingomonadales bacterium]|nr:helix-turn-helix transcriptional regulator [Sphingomonadales bacterium]